MEKREVLTYYTTKEYTNSLLQKVHNAEDNTEVYSISTTNKMSSF